MARTGSNSSLLHAWAKTSGHVFLEQIAQSDPAALHLVVWDQAGFHPRDGEVGVPDNVRLLSLPAYSPELNPVEQLGDLRQGRHLQQNLLHPQAVGRGPHVLVASANACAKY